MTPPATEDATRLRTLLVLRHLPFPPRDGGDLRCLHLIDALAALGPTSVFGLDGAGPDGDSASGADPVTWTVASDPDAGRTPRGSEILDALREQRSPFSTVASPTTVIELLRAVDDFAPDVVVVSGLELFDYLEPLRPRSPRLVLDLDYPQAAALGEMARADPVRQRGLLWRHVASHVAREESDAVTLADQVWVSNPGASEQLQAGDASAVPASIAIVPNVVDVGSYDRAARADPGALVFTARFDFWPNEEAARVLVQEILPHLPDASLALVGIAPPQWLRELADPRVTVTGQVPDVRAFLTAASVMPVPLNAGAGTRLKVLEAFATGLPVVSTAKGVEGLGLVDGEHYLCAEQPAEFVAAIERLTADESLAAHLIDGATALVELRYSLTALRDAVAAALG